MHVTDENLMDAIRQNDYASYNNLFIRYYSCLCQYVYGMLMDKDDAEDVVQELFLNLWNHRKKIEIKVKVSAYLYRMAKNLTLNHLRVTTKHQELSDQQNQIPANEEDEKSDSDEYRIALYDCINRLPPRSRQVLLLHRMDGLKQKEISDKLSISVKTIKNQIWTSLQKLKICLESKSL